MLIAHITDSHIEIPEPAGAGRIADFEKVVADINQLEEQPDLVIHTGDISHCDSKAEYRLAQSLLERLHVPCHVIPGNKDSRENMAQIFGLANGFIQSVIDTPDWQLVLLDTLSDTTSKGAFCAERLQWLKQVLSASQKPLALFMHHPTYEMAGNPYPFQFEDYEQADGFETLVAPYGHVKGIFCGHAHRNTKGMIADIPAMTLTAMALDRRKGTYPPAMQGKPVYQLIRFQSNGVFDCQLKVCG